MSGNCSEVKLKKKEKRGLIFFFCACKRLFQVKVYKNEQMQRGMINTAYLGNILPA